MSKIDFRGRYGSAGSKEVYFARIRKGLDFEKASFGGDRSAAGRYAANMRWQGQKKVEPATNRTDDQATEFEQSLSNAYAKNKVTTETMTEDEMGSLLGYRGLGFFYINQLLRTPRTIDYGNEKMNASAAKDQEERIKDAEVIDALIDRTPPLEEDLIVFRGMKTEAAQAFGFTSDRIMTFRQPEPQKITNKVIVDKGFASTSLVANRSMEFGGSGFFMEIKIPKGKKALFMNTADMETRKYGSDGKKMDLEHEVLLPRNTAFQIKGLRRFEGFTVIEAEVVS